MAKTRITRHKEGTLDEIRLFDSSTPYENLQVGDVVELIFGDDSIEQCIVTKTGWDFSFFDSAGIYDVWVEPVKHNQSEDA